MENNVIREQDLKSLLLELEIRFGEDWMNARVEERNYPFIVKELNVSSHDVIIRFNGKYWEVWNKNGCLYDQNVWATRKVTIPPLHWMVIRDENHILWPLFSSIYDKPYNLHYVDCNGVYSDNPQKNYEGYTTLSIDQWYELIYLPGKNNANVGDWAFLYGDERINYDDDLDFQVLGKIIEKRKNIGFSTNSIVWWKYAYKIDINKPLNDEIEHFKCFLNTKHEWSPYN